MIFSDMDLLFPLPLLITVCLPNPSPLQWRFHSRRLGANACPGDLVRVYLVLPPQEVPETFHPTVQIRISILPQISYANRSTFLQQTLPHNNSFFFFFSQEQIGVLSEGETQQIQIANSTEKESRSDRRNASKHLPLLSYSYCSHSKDFFAP